jgi:hypothetical protein
MGSENFKDTPVFCENLKNLELQREFWPGLPQG